MIKSEKKILTKIKTYIRPSLVPYDFWFIYDEGKAIGWEGGFELNNYNHHFRNQYTISFDKKVIKNWN